MTSTTKLNLKLALAGVAGVLLLYGGWAAYRAHRNLVTLNVRNMPVRDVVKKLQWQTWETIVVHSNVQGNVTMKVRKVPLEVALQLVGEQTETSTSVLYPLYSKGSALVSLKKALRGEVDPMRFGWTNLVSRGFFGFGRGGGPGGFGGPGGGPMGMGGAAPTGDGLISLDIQNKDVAFATLAFARFGGTRVVPEDAATSLPVSLKLDKATVDEAVSKLAKKANRSYARLYAMRGEGGFGRGGGRGGPGGGPPEFTQRDGATNMMMDRRMFRGPEMTEEQREQMREQRQQQEAALMAALPAEERQKVEQAQQERQQMFEQVQNMSPEQRQQFMEQRFGGQAGMQQRMASRLKNTPPEQRAERTARRREFDYMRYQGIQPQGRPPGGGGGRPGGGPGGGGGRPGR